MWVGVVVDGCIRECGSRVVVYELVIYGVCVVVDGCVRECGSRVGDIWVGGICGLMLCV